MTHLIEFADLERTLGINSAPLDEGLADWVISTVSIYALDVTGQAWETPEDTPLMVQSILTLAARRLYTNPDRFNREGEDGYYYGLDESVTDAEVFTPAEEKRLQKFATDEVLNGLKKPVLGTVGTYRGDVYEPRGRWF